MKNIMRQITVTYMGEDIDVTVHNFRPGYPAPIAYTPDSPGFDDEGCADEVEYSANHNYPIVNGFLDSSDEFRDLVIEAMNG